MSGLPRRRPKADAPLPLPTPRSPRGAKRPVLFGLLALSILLNPLPLLSFPLLFPQAVAVPFFEEPSGLPELPVVEGDSEEVPVPIGELRKALQYKEGYDALLKLVVDEAVPKTNKLANDWNDLVSTYRVVGIVAICSTSFLLLDLLLRR